MATASLKINGMSCMHCAMAVNKALKGVAGVTDAKVEVGSAQVSFDPGTASIEQIKAAVESAGYDVASASAS